jgi:hypothetical protein
MLSTRQGNRLTKSLPLALCLLSFSLESSASMAADKMADGYVPPPVREPAKLALVAEWKSSEKRHPTSQTDLLTPNVIMHTYGQKGALLLSVIAGQSPLVWNGMCASICTLTVEAKDHTIDLTGPAHIKWLYRATEFHEVRPVLKLVDGTWLVGDHVDGEASDFHISDIVVADVRWKALDVSTLADNAEYTESSGPGLTWVDKPDLSKVEEIGWTDLTIGNGRGTAGWVYVGKIEVFGKLVQRTLSAPASAQASARQRRGVPPLEASRPPVLWRAEWIQAPKMEQHDLSQADLATENLRLQLYGDAKNWRFTQSAPIEPPHIWNGMCTVQCAFSLEIMDSDMDLSGRAAVRWLVKANGFELIRPMVELADGTWLIGDHADGVSSDFRVSEFSLADVRWKRLDIKRVVESSESGAWVEHPDLSRVHAFGAAALAMPSFHGSGGWVDIGWVEITGRAVSRETASN